MIRWSAFENSWSRSLLRILGERHPQDEVETLLIDTPTVSFDHRLSHP